MDPVAVRTGPDEHIPAAPLDVAIGLPTELLRRRPDIRREERNMASQSAHIGVAVAELYPQFSLTGTIDLCRTAARSG